MSTTKDKKIVLLFSRSAMEKKKANPMTLTTLFNNEAKGDGVEYLYVCYDDLIHYIDRDGAQLYDAVSGVDLKDFDLVYHRRWGDVPEVAMGSAMYLSKHNVIQLDDEILRPGAMNKLTQYWRLWEHDLPFPKTVFMSRKHLASWIDESLENTLGLPCIMKSTNGTRGRDNYLVHSTDEAKAILRQNPDIEFLLQAFIPNDGDYRVLVCDDKVGMVIYRKAAQGTHKNNTSLGGSAQLVTEDALPSAAIRASIKAAQVFKRNLAGVDIVFDKTAPEKFYFFEVNRAPQIEASSYSEEKVAVLHEYFTSLINKEETAS